MGQHQHDQLLVPHTVLQVFTQLHFFPMKMFRLVLQTLLVAAVVNGCFGCSCLAASFEERFCIAELSVRGRVIAQYDNCPGKCDPLTDQLKGKIFYIVKVLTKFKGPEVEDNLLFLRTEVNGALCGISLSVGTVYLLNIRASLAQSKSCPSPSYAISLCDLPTRWARVTRKQRLFLRAGRSQQKCRSVSRAEKRE